MIPKRLTLDEIGMFQLELQIQTILDVRLTTSHRRDSVNFYTFILYPQDIGFNEIN